METLNRFTSKLVVLVLVGVLAFVLLATQMTRQHQRQLDSQRWVAHTLQVQDEANIVLITALDGSNAVRGFVIAGNPAFLAPYEQMRTSLLPRLKKLTLLTGDNPVQQKNLAQLKPLLQARLDESAIQLRLYHEQGAAAAGARVTAGIGLKINQDLRRVLEVIQDEESRLLLQRETALNQIAKQTYLSNIGVLGLMLVLMLLIGWLVRREMLARMALTAERDLMNAELETKNANLLTANDALQEADRLKTEFLSAMSHELRTPLNSIIGFTGILRMGIPGPLNDEQMKQLTMVEGSAKHLLHLINDLLDLSRIEAGRASLDMADFDFHDVLKETLAVVAPLANKKGLVMRSDCGTAPMPMHTDRRKVYQILLNLVNNAIKFSEHGDISIRCQKIGNSYEISVTDHGIGITPEQLKMLFQAFRQVDGSARRVYEGTGLGLYLSKKLVEMLGGSIDAKSEFGKGSCFSFILTAPKTGETQ